VKARYEVRTGSVLDGWIPQYLGDREFMSILYGIVEEVRASVGMAVSFRVALGLLVLLIVYVISSS